MRQSRDAMTRKAMSFPLTTRAAEVVQSFGWRNIRVILFNSVRLIRPKGPPIRLVASQDQLTRLLQYQVSG